MIDFYYQIKGRGRDMFNGWAWPPLYSGKITADNKKKARILVEEEFGRKIPMRVLKDDKDEPFLLHLTEFDEHHVRLFESKACIVCGKEFRRIDLYNDVNETYKGTEYCSSVCKTIDYERAREETRTSVGVGAGVAIIYGIRNKRTGFWYVGKTKQVFTLRWYQHFFHGGNTKFHKEIKETPITEWEFNILEQIQVPDGECSESYIPSREKYWIDNYNAINEGYNSANIL